MATTDSDDVANRRAQLRRWIKDRCDNKQAVFVERSGINQGELSSLLKNKAFGEKRARSLERAAGMPHKFLDQRGSANYPENSETEPAIAGESDWPRWPFARITPRQYERLSASEKLAIEQIVALFVSRANAASPATSALIHA